MLSEANGLSRRAQRCFAQHDTALPILVVKFHNVKERTDVDRILDSSIAHPCCPQRYKILLPNISRSQRQLLQKA